MCVCDLHEVVLPIGLTDSEINQEFRGAMAWRSHRLPSHSFPGLFSPLSAIRQLLAAVGGNYECKISQNGLCCQNAMQGVGDKHRVLSPGAGPTQKK